MVDKQIISAAHQLNMAVHENSSEYYHTRPVAVSNTSLILPEKQKFPFGVSYGVKDLLLIGAITESPVLITGDTDWGKTTLAMLVMNGLFGKQEEGWHRLDFDNDFGKDSYTDVSSDFFHEAGKSLKDLYSLHSWMKLPGLIADELNAAHPMIARKALHIINEKNINLPDGRRVSVGYDIESGNGRNDSGKTYQFQIAAINEGEEYHGVFPMDKALRRRTTLEIPMNIFTPTEFDRKINRLSGRKQATFHNLENHIEIILKIHESLQSIPMHPAADLFVAYLEAFDYCSNSITKEKSSVPSKGGSVRQICTQPVQIGSAASSTGDVGCPYLAYFDNELCPYVRGITPGLSKNLIEVAKGFAVLRATKFAEMVSAYSEKKSLNGLNFSLNSVATDELSVFEKALQNYVSLGNPALNGVGQLNGVGLGKAAVEKYISELSVLREDILTAAPFVGYSKIGISPVWTMKHWQGNQYEAVSHFARVAMEKFDEGISDPQIDLARLLGPVSNSTNNNEAVERAKSYCNLRNPWLWKAIAPYVTAKREIGSSEQALRLYE